MNLEHFCTKLSKLELSHAELALAILWFFDEQEPNVVKKVGELAKIIRDTGLGSPNTTLLRNAIRQSGKAIMLKNGMRLKVLVRGEIRESLQSILGATKPQVDQDLGYIPKDVWIGTRGYIEKVCTQMNGCYQFEFYDATSVMLRRLVETLIIEAYEKLNRENEIKDGAGNFMMLRDLVIKVTNTAPIGLGRDAKDALGKIKEMGDRSAHNRRYNATRPDLDKVQSGVRVITDELINIAQLRTH